MTTIQRLCFLLVLVVGIVFVWATPVYAQNVTLHLFWASGCPHCAKEKVFLQALKEKHPGLVIREYEITTNRGNALLLETLGEKLDADVSGVPFTLVGGQFIKGYLNDETTGVRIEAMIAEATASGAVDALVSMQQDNQPVPQKPVQKNVPESLHLPVFGELKTKSVSLPILTLVIALLDGFNPCAMWTLLFLISLLLGMKDRKRMWILGITFIVSSAFVYFLFLSAWLNLFLFLGFVVWVRMLIGVIALSAGGYYLRDWWVNRSGACAVMGSAKRQRVFEKLREITQARGLLLALVGIILLAFAVNMVELVCSAGLPAIYTNILSLTGLPRWQYYLYLVLYVFVFMADDLFVFVTAMVTLKVMGVESKYARLSHLIGGVLMCMIGLAMLFKPELLMFG